MNQAGRGGTGGDAVSGAGEAGQGGAPGGEAGQSSAGEAGETFVVAGAGGDDGASAGVGGDGGMEPGPDIEPPTIVEVAPVDAAIGVRPDAEIVVTFSEPMNRALTEIAYDSADLPPADVSFSWSDGDRKLTILPDSALEYSVRASSDPEPEPVVYAYTLGATGRDKAGNQLGADASFSFETVRALTVSLPLAGRYRVGHPASGSDMVTANTCVGQQIDLGEQGMTTAVGLLAEFSTTDLAAVVEPEGLLAARLELAATPSHPVLGPLHVDRVNVELSAMSWSVPVLESVLPATPSAVARADVRSGLWDDLTTRTDDLTQFFIHYEQPIVDDGMPQSVSAACSSLLLSVDYLAP